MNNEPKNHWMNYRTGKYELRPQGFILTATDEQALDYLPQNENAKGMYECLRAMGKSVPDAMIYVLEAVTGIEHTEPIVTAR